GDDRDHRDPAGLLLQVRRRTSREALRRQPMKPFLEKHFGKLWLLVVFGFLYLPLAFMVLFSFNSTRTDARFTGFSLRWYEALLDDRKIVDGFFLSLKIAGITGLLSAVLATFAAFVLVRYRRFLG